jgi:broad specificity phosphatase PhoE
MRAYLLRHAEAVPGTPDASRDLTAHGQRQVALLAKGAGQVPLEEVEQPNFKMNVAFFQVQLNNYKKIKC